jgi:hypothetical protein
MQPCNRLNGPLDLTLQVDKLPRMKYRAILSLSVIVFVSAHVPTMAVAGNCLSHPEPFQLQSDVVQWSMVVGRSGECIQGLRGRTMILESVSVLEQPKAGQVILQGPSFRYLAGTEAGSDTFKLAIIGTSMRIHGTSIVSVDVQVR